SCRTFSPPRKPVSQSCTSATRIASELSAGGGSVLYHARDQLGLLALDRDAELHLRARVLRLQRGGLLLHDLGQLVAVGRGARVAHALARRDERGEELVHRARRLRLFGGGAHERVRRLVAEAARALVEPGLEEVALVGAVVDLAHRAAPLLPEDLVL